MNPDSPFGLPPLDTRCDLCAEPEYLNGFCYRHWKEKYEVMSRDSDEDEPDRYEDTNGTQSE